MNWFHLGTFIMFMSGSVYGLAWALRRSRPRIVFPEVFLYMATMAMLGVFGEVFIGSLYNHIFDKPLWIYHVAPIHHGYTSYVAPLIWGLFGGFYLYLAQAYMRSRGLVKTRQLALVFSLETIILELYINGLFLLIFGKYLFYYLPGDLGHLTSLQAIPFYLLAGVIFTGAIKRFKADPYFFSLMAISLCAVLVYT